MNRWSYLFIACAVVTGLKFPILSSPQTRTTPADLANVPFVGCKSDGQIGPLDAPKTSKFQAQLDSSVAGRLALYMAQNGPAVLGPRGWACIGRYGSSAAMVYVTPQPISANMFDGRWEGISGPGIQASVTSGETSGRFTVARIAARVFPAERSYVENVIAEGLVPARDFSFGPFPADKLTYLNGGMTVEYETPARSQGLGTSSGLLSNDDPIRGVAIFDHEGPALGLLAIRLPENLNDLAPIITKQFEIAH